MPYSDSGSVFNADYEYQVSFSSTGPVFGRNGKIEKVALKWWKTVLVDYPESYTWPDWAAVNFSIRIDGSFKLAIIHSLPSQ